MKLKFDASSLILCQKLDIVPIVNSLYGSVYITNEVHKETIENAPLKYHSISEKIKAFINQELINKIDAHGIALSNLGKGESETLAEVQFQQLKKEDAIFVTDDKKAKKQTIAMNLKTLSVDFILVEACVRNIITEEEFERKIIEFDKIHKLNLIRITELRYYVQLFKSEKGKK